MLDEFRDLAGAEGVDFGYSLVRYLYDAGERDDAVARYRELMAHIEFPLRKDLLAGATLCNLAYVAAQAGDATGAARIYDALSPLAGQFANTTVAKPITEHFLGMLAAVRDDVATAERHFEVALAAHLEARAPLHAAETQLEWARLLVARRGRSRSNRCVDERGSRDGALARCRVLARPAQGAFDVASATQTGGSFASSFSSSTRSTTSGPRCHRRSNPGSLAVPQRSGAGAIH